jgi:hypothetical protein
MAIENASLSKGYSPRHAEIRARSRRRRLLCGGARARGERSDDGCALRFFEVLISPRVQQTVLALGVCAQLVDEVARGVEADDVQVDAHAELGQPGADVPVLLQEGACIALTHSKEGRDQLRFLRFEMGEQTRFELGP